MVPGFDIIGCTGRISGIAALKGRTAVVRGPRNGPLRWLACFATLSTALFTTVLLVLWATGSFEQAELSASGWVALFLGITLTSALGVALMGLVFYSDRQGVDERNYQSSSRDERRAT